MSNNVQPLVPRIRGEGNRRVTQGLFIEFGDFEKSFFTVNNTDKEVTKEGVTKTFYSFRRLYVECLDPTDIKFIDKYLNGDYEHFQALVNNKNLELDIESMREEVALRLQSIALAKLLQAAPSSSKDALQAAKYLGSRNWETSRKQRGRPKKQDNPASTDYDRLKDFLK